MIVDIVESEGRVEVSGLDAPVWFTGQGLRANGDAALCVSLLVAMARNEDLELVQPVSARLLEQTDEIQDILATWNPEFQRVNVVASEVPGNESRALRRERDLLFFSGGVDSFVELRNQAHGTPDLALVLGFDIALKNSVLSDETVRHVEAIASELGRDLLVVSTNLRRATRRSVHWNWYHGAALAGVAHLLVPERAVIASTAPYGRLRPWGSHPLLDRLWTGDATHIEHSGARYRRLDKVALLKDDEIAQRSLRVCYKNTAYNCCRCEKCRRTMVALSGLGVLDRFVTFPEPLRLIDIARTPLETQPARAHARDNFELLRDNGQRLLATAVAAQLAMQRVRAAGRSLSRPVRAASDRVGRLMERHRRSPS